MNHSTMIPGRYRDEAAALAAAAPGDRVVERTDIVTGGGNALRSTWFEIEPAPSTRVTCRVLTARGDRCTGEALDPDPKTIQICQRHAGEVMALINDRLTATRSPR
jgi:hypothetical protein